MSTYTNNKVIIETVRVYIFDDCTWAFASDCTDDQFPDPVATYDLNANISITDQLEFIMNS